MAQVSTSSEFSYRTEQSYLKKHRKLFLWSWLIYLHEWGRPQTGFKTQPKTRKRVNVKAKRNEKKEVKEKGVRRKDGGREMRC